MRITIEEIKELNDWINSFESDDEYWEMQPQTVLPNYSDYIVYTKQGLIWSCKRNKWVGAKNKKDGYWYCTLYGDDGTIWNTKVHRAIWIAVNGAIPKGYEINHIDEDKSNCSISNLELVTHKENLNYGTRNERAGKAISKAKTNGITSKQVAAYKDEQLIMVFPSTQEAGRNGYKQSAVSACCRNKLPHYKGYNWRYI